MRLGGAGAAATRVSADQLASAAAGFTTCTASLIYMRPIPELKMYHQFMFSKASPGNVVCKRTATAADDEADDFNIIKDVAVVSQDLPLVLKPEPLYHERQRHLAEKVRPYVKPRNILGINRNIT